MSTAFIIYFLIGSSLAFVVASLPGVYIFIHRNVLLWVNRFPYVYIRLVVSYSDVGTTIGLCLLWLYMRCGYKMRPVLVQLA